MDRYPFLGDFEDAFLDELPGLPPKRALDFSIDMIPGSEPISKSPYRMTTTELMELRAELWELLIKD